MKTHVEIEAENTAKHTEQHLATLPVNPETIKLFEQNSQQNAEAITKKPKKS